MSEKYLPQVRAQYEDYPYPPVDPQDEKKRLKLTITEIFPYISHYTFSGKKDLRKGSRFLVAGGGTGDAAVSLAEQLRDSDDCELFYVDISEASMNIARERARIRGLEHRIKWYHGSLLEVGKWGIGEFDYVNSSGVLHHLADPQKGLDALVSVLKPNGTLGIMVYAEYGRMPVYQMQNALRMVNHGITDQQQKVENTKKILKALPGTNWLHQAPPALYHEVRAGDAAIYDLLLHSQDRAYTIPQLHEWLRSSGVQLLELFPDDFTQGKRQYDAGNCIHDAELLKHVRKLPAEQQQALAELLNGKIYKHTFYAKRSHPPLPSITDPDMVPFFNLSFTPESYQGFADLVNNSVDQVAMQNGNITVTFSKTPHLDLIVAEMDGKRSMGEIYKQVVAQRPSLSHADFLREFAQFYDALNEYHWVILRHKDIPPYLSLTDMHARMPVYA